MIHLITGREDKYNVNELLQNDIVISSASDFRNFIQSQKSIQLDTETNVVRSLFTFKEKNPNDKTPHWILDENGQRIPVERELYVVQIGDYTGEEQWIFDITGLTGLKLKYLKDCLDNKELKKIIHNANFEYTIIKKTFGIDLNKIRDTMLMSKILKTGIETPKGFHGLAGCVKRYFNIDISKEAQTTFSSDPMSVLQILYAATDVTLMGKLHDALQLEIEHWQLENTVKVECAYVRASSDAFYDNLYLDIPKWRELMAIKEQEIKDSEEELFSILRTEFLKQSEEVGFIQANDTYLFSWGSSKMKRDLMQLVYPDMPKDCTTLPAYKKYQAYLKSNEEEVSTEVLDLYLKRNFEGLERYFINNHQQYLLDNGLFVPKGTININFNSPDQVLQLFRFIKPDLISVNKKNIPKVSHPLAKSYKNYKKVTKLYQSYGQNFIDACSYDGMLRVQNLNQIVNTGRISMALFQLLPQKGGYRECFYAEDGWTICGIDYSSQELVVAGTISGEPVVLEALEKGWDMHSICASLMFPNEWAEAGEDPKPKGKPKSKKGDDLRSYSKRTSFGIMYGKSAIGLAEDLDLYANTDELFIEFEQELDGLIRTSCQEEYAQFIEANHSNRDNKTARKAYIRYKRAKGEFMPDEITGDDLVQRFKNALPILNNYLSNNAESAKSKLFSRTNDILGRIRFFEKPENEKEASAIFREAMNFPIQGSSAGMTKYACILIKNYVEDHNLQDKVKMLFAVHDEILTKVKLEFSEEWCKIKMKLMEDAGTFILDNHLQKAEGGCHVRWTK